MNAGKISSKDINLPTYQTLQHKLLLPLLGKPVLAHTLERLCGLPFGEIVVVTGFEREGMEEVCASFSKVRTVCNPDASEGMASSLRTGVTMLNAKHTGILILLADMPLVRTETLERLCRQFRQSSRSQPSTQPIINKPIINEPIINEPIINEPIIVPVCNGQRGNPVLFSAAYKPELLTLRGDTGARRLLHKHADHVVECHTDDEGVVLDLDTPEQWHKLSTLAIAAASCSQTLF
jgi:molybdenum cofactor cytidylyltransferase